MERQAKARLTVTRLDVAVAAVNSFRTLVAAEQKVRAGQADVERREVFAKSVHILVDNQLRAGADASRADADLARARANLARARQQQEVSRAALADFLGIADIKVVVREGPLAGSPPENFPSTSSISTHPVAEAQEARVQEFQSRVRVLDRSYYPKFNVQSALYGRGTGANTDGTFQGGTGGLGVDRSNWAVGLTVTFSLFDIFSIRARKGIEEANEKAEAARYEQITQDLTGQLKKAQATAVELQAARATETQERARYQAGLATLVDVSDAQSLLVRQRLTTRWHTLPFGRTSGALVGPSGGSGSRLPLVKVEQTNRLRLVVPIPEKYVAGMVNGARVDFTVPAYPSETFSGTIARIAHSVDVKTRTMPVELDVNNPGRRLSSGMFPEVLWPVNRSEATLFVPTSAVARTTEATFVVRIRNRNSEWMNVRTGEVDGKLTEIFGDVHEGDEVAVRGTDELRPGTRVNAQLVVPEQQRPSK